MLGIVKAQQLLAIAMDRRLVDNHLGVQQRMPRQLPVKIPAMTIRPVDHGRNGKCMLVVIGQLRLVRIAGVDFRKTGRMRF